MVCGWDTRGQCVWGARGSCSVAPSSPWPWAAPYTPAPYTRLVLAPQCCRRGRRPSLPPLLQLSASASTSRPPPPHPTHACIRRGRRGHTQTHRWSRGRCRAGHRRRHCRHCRRHRCRRYRPCRRHPLRAPGRQCSPPRRCWCRRRPVRGCRRRLRARAHRCCRLPRCWRWWWWWCWVRPWSCGCAPSPPAAARTTRSCRACVYGHGGTWWGGG